jgi:hypothetical protein
MVAPLESMRHEMKELVLQTKNALVEANVPSKRRTNDNTAYYYQSNSWMQYNEVPWVYGNGGGSGANNRAMTPAEGVQWLAGELKKAKAKPRARGRATEENDQTDNPPFHGGGDGGSGGEEGAT